MDELTGLCRGCKKWSVEIGDESGVPVMGMCTSEEVDRVLAQSKAPTDYSQVRLFLMASIWPDREAGRVVDLAVRLPVDEVFMTGAEFGCVHWG